MSNDPIATQQEIAPDATTYGAAQPAETTTTPPPARHNIRPAYSLALMAIFVALGLVLNVQSAIMIPLASDIFGRASLVYAYCWLCGILLGPWRGGFCAAVSDTLVAIILPSGGIYMPLISLSNFVMAAIPGLLHAYVLRGRPIGSVVVSSVLCLVVCTLGLTALGETLLYDYFGSAPYYPSITVLRSTTQLPTYLCFVLFKLARQPFWMVANLAVVIPILCAPAVRSFVRTSSPRRATSDAQTSQEKESLA